MMVVLHIIAPQGTLPLHRLQQDRLHRQQRQERTSDQVCALSSTTFQVQIMLNILKLSPLNDQDHDHYHDDC